MNWLLYVAALGRYMPVSSQSSVIYFISSAALHKLCAGVCLNARLAPRHSISQKESQSRETLTVLIDTVVAKTLLLSRSMPTSVSLSVRRSSLLSRPCSWLPTQPEMSCRHLTLVPSSKEAWFCADLHAYASFGLCRAQSCREWQGRFSLVSGATNIFLFALAPGF